MTRLPTHERFPYTAIDARRDFAWPGGARLACYVAINVEHFAFGEGLGAALVPKHAEPDVLNYTWREYGNRVGVWRLLEMLDALRLPAAALINTSIYDHAPEIVAAFRARGDEIVAHGVTNAERQADMADAAERAMIAAATARIAKEEGAPPRGWLGPWISQSHATPDLLAEAGYAYLLDWAMDDQPVRLATRGGGGILAVPYPQELNDVPAIAVRRAGAREFATMILDQFEEMLAQSARQPLVMGVALHPYIAGQPFRLRPLREALAAIRSRPGVWWTTPGAIAAHVAER